MFHGIKYSNMVNEQRNLEYTLRWKGVLFLLNLTLTILFLAQKFTSQFGIIKDFGCSVAVNRSTVVFIGGHYMEIRLIPGNQGVHFAQYKYIPLKWPINDQVFLFSFLNRNWTELPKVPNIQVSLAKKYFICFLVNLGIL